MMHDTVAVATKPPPGCTSLPLGPAQHVCLPTLRIRSSVDFWYLRISRRATVPGRYLWGFLTPPVAGALFLAALVASCLRGALPPVDLRAVCLVRAISDLTNCAEDASGPVLEQRDS